jgi:hypothetical protein
MEAPDRIKFVASCSDLAATDGVMERRFAARKRVLKRGMVELRESALTCKIIDLSKTGAGLALSGASHVPNFFTLLIPDRAPVFCQIVWRRQERLGVAFRELRGL